jgi:hypothetical protein
MRKYLIILLIFSIFAGLWACKKDRFTTNASDKLAFSADSILFDTVFTTVGSTTRSFKIYNRHKESIRISSIRLARGSASNFRINVDGTPGISFNDVEIAANDSAFVFVEVTVNPSSANTPFVITDSVAFSTNGNEQYVKLEAWGQNAHFHANEYLNCNEVWTNDKPHVIYGLVVIPPGCTLTIQQNVRVHLHAGAVLAADSAASLIVNGALSSEVTFQGDRLEPEYNEAPGQWGTIYLSAKSSASSINYAIIKNGYIGIRCDSFPSSGPRLTIKNTFIRNMSAAALYGIDSKIDGYNSVFANCGQYVGAFTIGGQYSFYHCTFANYWNYGTRQFPTLLLNNYYTDVNDNIQTRSLDSANFYNCIIYGDADDEIRHDQSTNTGPAFNFKYHNCVLKTTYNTSFSNYVSCVVNLDAAFMNAGANDYRLGSTSSAINAGDLALLGWPGFSFLNNDLKGDARTIDGPPDCGAFEYEP